ncbi:G-type lectin S-receptor-like serine/threonine-protein kinase [Arachis hypogaea]|nr:G-type lectin S-receptor-like serine/threonine-protein kinase [Arachis hypogaea]
MSCMRTITSRDSLEVGQSIQDGETLVSAGGSFELGFFSPGIPTNRYLGVWYRDASGNSTVVWVANREIPIQSNSSGVLRLSKKGILQLLNGTNSTIWSSNTSGNTLGSLIAQLLDSGNLVVKNGQSTEEKNFLWQSFDYPCDTLMPGMKLGLNLVTGFDISMSSWKSAEDPAVGEYSIKFDPRGYPQVMQWKGSVKYFRIGTFNGLYFTGYPTQEDEYRQDFVLDKTEVYYKFEILDRSIFYLYKLQPSGTSIGTIWRSQTRTELELATIDGYNGCGSYAFCGSNAICKVDANLASCECLKGYVPKFPQQWNMSNWSDGCVRKTSLDCNDTNSFLWYTDIKVPDTSSSWYNKTMDLKECEKICLKNCSCVAYANLDIRNGGSGCLLWFDNLIDMIQFSRAGQDIYIKVPTSELGNDHGNMKKKKVGIAIGATIFGLITSVTIVIMKKSGVAKMIQRNRQRQKVTELPTFDFSVLVKATENFSSSNKLGEGGFGSVYKGTLTNGQELAVKRLSKKSKQGLEEFKNEVALIAKLQHRNLVKLLGCCIQGVEKILIYEYMPNKSLDYFVFDANLNPKISDFGLARTFLGDQLEANTNRVAGTYGYMPPEYAVHGQYSMKSDVFSYGVILLELISGKKNREFSDPENYLNLLGHAWRLWTDEKPLELLDEVLKEGCTPLEVKRCIQVGLLCVQQRPEDRPDMSSVVLMLNGEKLLPKPKVPGFYTERGVTIEADSLMQNHTLFSANEISITTLYAR